MDCSPPQTRTVADKWVTQNGFRYHLRNHLALAKTTKSGQNSYMPFINDLSALALFSAALLTAIFGAYCWRRRDVPGAAALTWLLVCVSGWSLTLGMQTVSRSGDEALFWKLSMFTVLAFMPVAGMVFVLHFSGRAAWLTLPRLAGLLMIPVATTIVIWSNSSHHWFVRAYAFEEIEGRIVGTVWQTGFWYWIHSGYGFLLVAALMLVAAITALRSPQPYRGQASTILFWGGLSGLVALPFSFGSLRISDGLLSLLPFMNSLGFVWAVFRFRLFDLVPVARHTLVESMRGGMLAVDTQGRIVDANPSAEKMIGLSRFEWMGRPIAQLTPPWNGLAANVNASEPSQTEIIYQQPGQALHVHAEVTPLAGRGGQRQGSLVALHDLTTLKWMETLEERVSARTRELSTLYTVASLISAGQNSSGEEHVCQILTGCLAQVIHATRAVAGLIGLPDAQGQVRLSADHNLLPALHETVQVVLAAEPGTIGKDGLLLHDLAASNPFHLEGLPYPSLIAVPIPVHENHNPCGVLVIFGPQPYHFNVEDLGLLLAVAGQISIALENDYLRQQAALNALAAERQRLARDLHDSVTQLLYSQILFTDAAHKNLTSGAIGQAADYLTRVGEISRQALREIRLLIYQLRPTNLENASLFEALERRLELVEQRSGIDAQLEGDRNWRFPALIESNLYRIAEEALNNALKHAKASRVFIRLRPGKENWTELEISDNGCGFTPDTVQPGMGLSNLRERAAQLGGQMEIRSNPGQGTSVMVRFPQPSQMRSFDE
jgi:PAS domain S-box-containing protein